MMSLSSCASSMLLLPREPAWLWPSSSGVLLALAAFCAFSSCSAPCNIRQCQAYRPQHSISRADYRHRRELLIDTALCPALHRQGARFVPSLTTPGIKMCHACKGVATSGSLRSSSRHATAHDMGVVWPDAWGPTAAFFCFLPCTFFRRKNSSRSSSSSSPWHAPTHQLRMSHHLCASSSQPPITTQNAGGIISSDTTCKLHALEQAYLPGI